MNIINQVELEPRIATSGQPTADQFFDIFDWGADAVINLAMPDSDNALANEGELVSRLDMAYFHIPVPFDAPTSQHLELFLNLMAALQNRQLWIHCALNYRVSAFMYHYRRKVQLLPKEKARSPIFDIWQPDPIWTEFLNIP